MAVPVQQAGHRRVDQRQVGLGPAVWLPTATGSPGLMTWAVCLLRHPAGNEHAQSQHSQRDSAEKTPSVHGNPFRWLQASMLEWYSPRAGTLPNNSTYSEKSARVCNLAPEFRQPRSRWARGEHAGRHANSSRSGSMHRGSSFAGLLTSGLTG